MRKLPKILLPLLLILVAVYFGWRSEELHKVGREILSSRTSVSQEEDLNQNPASLRSVAPESKEQFDVTVERIRAVSSKALPSKDEAAELAHILSDKQVQDRVFSAIASGDSQSFHVEKEKERMEMISIINLMLRQPNFSDRQSIVDRIVERVEKVDFAAIKDIKQKQSILGDTIELLRVVKAHDPEAYGRLKVELSSSQQKPILHALYVAG